MNILLAISRMHYKSMACNNKQYQNILFVESLLKQIHGRINKMQENNMESVNWSDVINTDILSNFNNDISLLEIGVTLLISFLLGLFIYTLYRRIFSGVLYSKSFNISLVGLAMITSLIIMAISSNLVLSLGMVGALSIVRFRTPIKDPTDLIFLFWALATGI